MGSFGIVVCTVLFCATVGVYGMCGPGNGNATEFIEIPESQWDRTWSDISDDGKRPLGFMKGTVYFNSPSHPNPCILVRGASDRHIEVKVENHGTPINMKDLNNNVVRVQRELQQCEAATASDMYYEFYLDPSQGGSESDVSFWYRFTKGPTSAEDSEEMWCQNRDNAFPGSLLTLPPNFDPSTTPKYTGSSTPLVSSVSLLIVTALFCVIRD